MFHKQDGALSKTGKPVNLSMQEHSLLKGSESRKRRASPATRRTRRKRRSGNKDGTKENPTSNSLCLLSQTGSDQQDEGKQMATTQILSGLISAPSPTSKQLPIGIGQNPSSSPDGCSPRKTQIRRRIRSQSKLSDLLTSSSNESLLSNK